MNTNDRYLNIQYGTLTAEVNITGISRLGGIQDAIKTKLTNSLAQVDAALIQLYTTNRDQLIKTWALFNSLPQEYFDEGLAISQGVGDVGVLRGVLFERHAHTMISNGGTFQTREFLDPNFLR